MWKTHESLENTEETRYEFPSGENGMNVWMRMFEALFDAFGPQHWWPGETPLEVAIGAILTQNTNWRNVERAIQNLKERDLIDVDKLLKLSEDELKELIRPSGFFNVKARRLRNFLEFLRKHGGLEGLKKFDTYEVRQMLLRVPGIGFETADSVILYALEKPIFVVDAYTRRYLKRHGFIEGTEHYDEIRKLFEDNLPKDVELYKEYHALIVKLGKVYCKSKPVCENCPLNKKEFWRNER